MTAVLLLPHIMRTPFLLALFFLISPLFTAVIHGRENPEQSFAILGTAGSIADVKRYPAGLDTLPTPPSAQKRISARSAIVIDTSENRVLFAKSPDVPRQPASTIKVLTGMIAIRSLTGKENVPVSREAASRPSSKMYLDPAKTYRADELITAVLLASSNDAAVALAEFLAGTEKEFAEIMTLQAQHWGATQTVCKTATGLTAKGQTSTARDLALIFREAMNVPDFKARIHQRLIKTDEGNTLYNHNKALWQVKGAEGGKTGYTLAARQTYVGQFTRGRATIIVAIMGSETMWNDLKYLVKYGFDSYRYLPEKPDSFPPARDLLVRSAEPEAADKANN